MNFSSLLTEPYSISLICALILTFIAYLFIRESINNDKKIIIKARGHGKEIIDNICRLFYFIYGNYLWCEIFDEKFAQNNNERRSTNHNFR